MHTPPLSAQDSAQSFALEIRHARNCPVDYLILLHFSADNAVQAKPGCL